jgi:hypothetical protein
VDPSGPARHDGSVTADRGNAEDRAPESSSPPAGAEPETGTEVVVRAVPLPDTSRTALRTRLGELARHPAVVTTATVGAGVAAGVVRELVRNGWPGRSVPAGPLRITAHVVQEVHVIHHVVHHVVSPQSPHPLLPPGPPRPSA